VIASILPSHAQAFWLFPSSGANVALNDPDSLSSSSPQPVLAAATNYDPNPDKGLTDSQVISDNALVAQQGPDGSIADVSSSSPSDRISVYIVRQGDTLSQIAQSFNISVNTIIWANDLTGPTDVHPGDTLIILPTSGIQHTVMANDTLASLAKTYSSDANDIAQFNGLDPTQPLAVGSTVIIPGGELGTAPSSPSPSSGGTSSPKKLVPSEEILQGQYASGNVIPLAYNRAEPARGVGPIGTLAQIDYYTSPLAHFVQTQDIHGYNAVDLAAPRGTPIMAAAAGTVIIARSGGWNGGYGSYVVIDHPNGSQTLYAHMSRVAAVPGEQVSQGQVIGYVGMTGDATGPHVHFEIRNGIRNPF
jgi:murein DD-endopeptidase MepM/ murein hydrolase activator NlpD